MKIIFQDIVPCSLVEVYHHMGDNAQTMEAVSTSETSLTFYQTTRRNIPQDNHFEPRSFSTV
jgi:hypothetical protein